MNIIIRVGLMLFALAVGGCDRGAEEHPATGDVLTEIPVDRIPALIRQARRGDLSSAATLATYYGSLENEYRTRRLEWLFFGAERGDCNAITILIEDMRFYGLKNEDGYSKMMRLADKFACDLPDALIRKH